MSKKKTQPCPECGGAMRYEKHSDEVTYLGHKRALDTLGWVLEVRGSDPGRAGTSGPGDGLPRTQGRGRRRARSGGSCSGSRAPWSQPEEGRRDPRWRPQGVSEVRGRQAGCERSHEPSVDPSGEQPEALTRVARRTESDQAAEKERVTGVVATLSLARPSSVKTRVEGESWEGSPGSDGRSWSGIDGPRVARYITYQLSNEMVIQA